ncbi:MAG: hypothetical protein ABW075_11140 [Aeromicrobium sp.]
MAEAVEPRTRAELLGRQRAELSAMSSRRWALRRLVLPVALSVALFCVGIYGFDATTDDGSSATRTVAFAVILAGWTWVMWRHVRTTRRLEAGQNVWAQADRTDAARSLPPGDLDVSVATIWDVRDSTELEQVASNVGIDRQLEIFRGSPVVSAVVGAIAGIVGAIAAVDAIVLDPRPGNDLVIAPVAFCLVALSGWTLTWTSGREYWRRQQAWNRVGLERQAYLERRRVLQGIEAAPEPQLPRWARPLAAAVVLLLVALIVVRVAWASAGVLVVTALILLVAALLIGVAVVRAQRLHVVPLRAGGTDVLSSPGRFVRADVADGTLTITDADGVVAPASIAVDRVRHVSRLSATYPWVPGPLLVITDDDVVVLAGRGTDAVRGRLQSPNPQQSRHQES